MYESDDMFTNDWAVLDTMIVASSNRESNGFNDSTKSVPGTLLSHIKEIDFIGTMRDKTFYFSHAFWYLLEVFSTSIYYLGLLKLVYICLLPDFRCPQCRGWIFSSPNRCQKTIHPS